MNSLEFVEVVPIIPNEAFFRSVRCVAHRAQCLYHCLVLGLEWCLYIIGDEGEINRVVAIHFHPQVFIYYVKYILVHKHV